jgi:uncharacterized protein with PQ loop repeat
MKVVGWIGTTLVMVAYYTQIHNLFVERCAWGISVSTWLIWFIASTLLLFYCISGKELLMSVMQVVSIGSYRNDYRPRAKEQPHLSYHRKVSETMARNEKNK